MNYMTRSQVLDAVRRRKLAIRSAAGLLRQLKLVEEIKQSIKSSCAA